MSERESLWEYAPNEYLPGMRDLYPHLCWMVNGDGSRVCLQDVGHDNGVHEPEPAPLYYEASDPIRLPALVRKAFSYPRFLSIGSENNTVEIRVDRELYEQIKVIIGKPVGE